MKVGDTYQSATGQFAITKITKTTITVLVDRVARKNGKRVIEQRVRDVPVTRFELFASPYRKTK